MANSLPGRHWLWYIFVNICLFYFLTYV